MGHATAEIAAAIEGHRATVFRWRKDKAYRGRVASNSQDAQRVDRTTLPAVARQAAKNPRGPMSSDAPRVALPASLAVLDRTGHGPAQRIDLAALPLHPAEEEESEVEALERILAGRSDCKDDESPVKPVTLTHDFYMGETEVTQAEYEAVMGTNPSVFTDCGTDCPVETVRWYDAAAYASALSSSAGLTECYACSGSGEEDTCDVAMSPSDCDGYRLPTEAEWESAARCGEDLLYAGSTCIRVVGWTNEVSGATPHLVAGKDAYARGLYDMSGNVWEWTQDWYANACTEAGRTDPEGATEGDYRVNRGGSWGNVAEYARVAFRRGRYPSRRFDDLCFRLARTVP